jgi:hypothetical protein
MEWQAFRLSREDKAKLKAKADKAGMTVSVIMRDLIRSPGTCGESNAIGWEREKSRG